MKINKQYILLVIGVISLSTSAQEIKVPQTPAFSILEYEPSAVMRPTSIKKLSTDILSSFDADGKLLMNLGMEVSPYWLTSRPELSREEFLHPKSFQNILQTFSISAATVKDSVTNKNNLGLGFRTQIVRGTLPPDFEKYEALLKKYEEAVALVGMARSLSGTMLTTREGIISFLEQKLTEASYEETDKKWIITKANQLKSSFTDETSSLRLYCEAINNALENKTTELDNKVIELETSRVGFSLEMAGAAKFVSQNQSGNSFNKLGIWLNANNFFTTTDAWTVTARYLTQVNQTNTANNTDLGFGYLKTGDKFNVSVEGMLRWYRQEFSDVNQAGTSITRLEKDFTYRIAGQIAYQLYENVSANFSFGKEFNEPNLKTDTFFSIFGIHYSIFNKRSDLYNINN